MEAGLTSLRLDVEIPFYVDDILVCLLDTTGMRSLGKALRDANRIVTEIGNSQWGISPSSWRQLYTGMVRVVASWGAEVAWRSQKAWRADFERLQYQALRNCTSAIVGANMAIVNKLAAVEDIDTIMEAIQGRFMARCLGDPSAAQDLWEVSMNADWVRDSAWLHWTDYSIRWHQQETAHNWDGYICITDRLLGRIELEYDWTSLSWGLPIVKTDLQVVDHLCTAKSPVSVWEAAINNVPSTSIYTDGSKSEGGVVGGGYFFSQGSLGIRVGSMATVSDGEVAGLERGLRAAGDCDRVLLITDSKAAIHSIQKACLVVQARTRALGSLGTEIGRRTLLYGPEAVKIAWVKSHIGIPGKEGADEAARASTEKDLGCGGEVTKDGVRMNIKEFQKANRTELRVLCIAGWDRHTATIYLQLQTNKGGLRSWRFHIGRATSPECRFCREAAETGEHITFKCSHWADWRVLKEVEGALRTWESWEDFGLVDWADYEEDGTMIDNVHRFFSQIDLREVDMEE